MEKTGVVHIRPAVDCCHWCKQLLLQPDPLEIICCLKTDCLYHLPCYEESEAHRDEDYAEFVLRSARASGYTTQEKADEMAESPFVRHLFEQDADYVAFARRPDDWSLYTVPAADDQYTVVFGDASVEELLSAKADLRVTRLDGFIAPYVVAKATVDGDGDAVRVLAKHAAQLQLQDFVGGFIDKLGPVAVRGLSGLTVSVVAIDAERGDDETGVYIVVVPTHDTRTLNDLHHWFDRPETPTYGELVEKAREINSRLSELSLAMAGSLATYLRSTLTQAEGVELSSFGTWNVKLVTDVALTRVTSTGFSVNALAVDRATTYPADRFFSVVAPPADGSVADAAVVPSEPNEVHAASRCIPLVSPDASRLHFAPVDHDRVRATVSTRRTFA